MKFAIVFAAVVAVACAGLQKPLDSNMAELEAIVAAIQSPSTDPATAALLEQQLADLLAEYLPAPAPVIVEEPSPVHIGLPIVDFPVPDGGILSPVPETPAVVPSPIVDASPAAEGASPLVQIILNINQASSGAAPVVPAPVETPIVPVQVVDEAVNEESIVPTPVIVVDSAPEPVQVVPAPVVPAPMPEVEPIQIGSPIIPTPVVNIPIELKTMKLLLTVVALVAFVHGAPTTQTMEIGANGVSGGVLNIPLVEIIVNMIGETVAPGTANEPVVEASPVNVVDNAPTPVVVVDNAPTPVVVVDNAPTPVVVVDNAPTPVVVVDNAPTPVVVVEHTIEVNPVDVIAVNPMPEPVVPTPVVLPEPAQPVVVPEPVVLPEPSPAEVVPSPTPVIVVPGPTPVEVAPAPAQIVEVPTPAEVVEVPAPGAAEGGSQIINVIMSFIFGANGALSSVEVPANVVPQINGVARV
ncbi:BCL-6 corepressor-like protein 1 [Leguminivora glycinivorella]|uniref:BCL-6 corepressor-like protein 1 n=1 Tax=Leguminivora glycinivorella TaxID=1035111 RepID=UPI00200D42A6|nr:BCL-6 corepressor-like protein 1 [Leguminivora glycinivorella]